MLMRATGRGSISSFLKVAVDVAWVLACALLGFIWVIAAVSIIAAIIGAESLGPLNSIVIHDPVTVAVAAFNGTVLCTAAMIVCAYLRGVFETLVAGDAFVYANAKRFRLIAIVLAVVELVHMGGRFFAPKPAGYVPPADGGASVPLDFSAWISALIVWFAVLTLLVLAEVFREAAAMREEQKMTI
jgi:hypothetical protein